MYSDLNEKYLKCA